MLQCEAPPKEIFSVSSEKIISKLCHTFTGKGERVTVEQGLTELLATCEISKFVSDNSRSRGKTHNNMEQFSLSFFFFFIETK